MPRSLPVLKFNDKLTFPGFERTSPGSLGAPLRLNLQSHRCPSFLCSSGHRRFWLFVLLRLVCIFTFLTQVSVILAFDTKPAFGERSFQLKEVVFRKQIFILIAYCDLLERPSQRVSSQVTVFQVLPPPVPWYLDVKTLHFEKSAASIWNYEQNCLRTLKFLPASSPLLRDRQE